MKDPLTLPRGLFSPLISMDYFASIQAPSKRNLRLYPHRSTYRKNLVFPPHPYDLGKKVLLSLQTPSFSSSLYYLCFYCPYINSCVKDIFIVNSFSYKIKFFSFQKKFSCLLRIYVYSIPF